MHSICTTAQAFNVDAEMNPLLESLIYPLLAYHRAQGAASS